MNKFKMKVTAVIGVILLIGIYYYVTLPAINIHASEFWMYLVVLVILAAVVFIRKKNLNRYDWKGKPSKYSSSWRSGSNVVSKHSVSA